MKTTRLEKVIVFISCILFITGGGFFIWDYITPTGHIGPVVMAEYNLGTEKNAGNWTIDVRTGNYPIKNLRLRIIDNVGARTTVNISLVDLEAAGNQSIASILDRNENSRLDLCDAIILKETQGVAESGYRVQILNRARGTWNIVGSIRELP